MFGIRIKDTFLDLGQRRFTVSLQSPLFWGGDSSEVIPSSLLLSVKAPLSKRNQKILAKTHLLSNPTPFLANEYAEIWAEGSPVFVGFASVTGTTDSDYLITIAINSVANLRNITLDTVNYGSYSGNGLQACYDSVLFPDAHPFACPTVLAPNQWGDEVTHFGEAGYQNLYRDEAFVTTNGAAIAPLLKMTHVLRGAFKEIGFKFENVFESDLEMSKLLLYYANPINTRAGNWRYSDFVLNRHVPSMIASDCVKYFSRFYNLGLFVDGFENKARLIRADKVLEGDNFVDWTNIVTKRYNKEEVPYKLGKLSMPMPDSLTNLYSTKRYEYSVSHQNDEDMAEGLYLTPNGEEYHYYKVHKPTILPKPAITATVQEWTDYWESIASTKILANLSYPHRIEEGNKTEYEAKVTAMPQARCMLRTANKFEVIGNFPVSYSRNGASDAPQDRMPLFFWRGKNETGVLASAEAHYMRRTFGDNAIAADVYDNFPFFGEAIKIGNKPASGSDTRPNAQNSVQFGGESGVYERHWKVWANFLRNKKEVELTVLPTIRHLRNFSLDKTIVMGNQHYLCKTLDIEFSEKGIEAAKGTFVIL